MIEITEVSGEANVVVIRGKKKIGYELEVQIDLKPNAVSIGEGVANITIKELCDDMGKPEYSLKVSEQEDKATKCKITVECRGVLTELTAQLRKLLNQL